MTVGKFEKVQQKRATPLNVLSGNYSACPQITYSSNFILSSAFLTASPVIPHPAYPSVTHAAGNYLKMPSPAALLKRETSYAVFSREPVNTKRKGTTSKSSRGRKRFLFCKKQTNFYPLCLSLDFVRRIPRKQVRVERAWKKRSSRSSWKIHAIRVRMFDYEMLKKLSDLPLLECYALSFLRSFRF